MARNVEEIVVQARDEASEVINNVAGRIGGFGEVLRRLAGTAGPVGLGLTTIAAGATGIVLVGAKLADTVKQLDLLSSRTGVSIERLQVFQQIITEAGGDAGTLTGALTFLNRSIAQNDPLLAKLGIRSKDVFEAFVQLADIFGRSTDTSKKSEIAFQLLGGRANELIGLLPKLSGEFAKMDTQMRASGALIGEEVAGQARKLSEELAALARDSKGALTRIQAEVVPWAAAIVEQFNEVWDAITGRKADLSTTAGVDSAIAKLQGNIEDLERTARGVDPLSPFDFDAIQRLANINRLLDEQKGRMRALLEVRSNLETAQEKAARGDVRGGPRTAATDSLAGVDPTIGKEDSAMKAREERLRELMRIMGVTRAEAVLLAATLDRIEDGKKRADLTKALTLGPEPSQEIEELNARIERTVELLELSKERATDLVKLEKERELAAEKERLDRALFQRLTEPAGPELPPGGVAQTAKDVGKDWATTLDAITSAAGVLDSTLSAVFSGLQSGFQTAFQNIISGSATVANTVGSIFRSLVDAILAELARLAAAAIVKTVGKALGVPGFGVTVPTTSATAGGGIAAFGQPEFATATTINVYSYDLRDGVRELTSLGGVSRLARARVNVLGRY